MLFTLATFGVLIDLMHIIAPVKLSGKLGLLEDGGEMVVMSVITTFVFVLSEQVKSKTEV